MSRKKKIVLIKKTGRLVLMMIIMTFIMIPFLACIGRTFMTEGEINSQNVGLFPKNPTFENVIELFSEPNILIGLKNSFLIGITVMILTVCISMPSAYMIARFSSKRMKSISQAWILVSQMIPGIIITVPLYMILKNLGLTDTFPGIVLVYVIWSIPTTLWMLRGFITGFPVELEEAAAIDGCSTLKVFTRIMLPNIIPGVLTTAIFAFIGAWNEFFFALCFIKSPNNITLSMTLYTYKGMSGQARDGMLAAACFFSSLPGIILFGFFQKYYVSGLTDGAVK